MFYFSDDCRRSLRLLGSLRRSLRFACGLILALCVSAAVAQDAPPPSPNSSSVLPDAPAPQELDKEAITLRDTPAHLLNDQKAIWEKWQRPVCFFRPKGWNRVQRGARLSFCAGKSKVIDGPFTEAKELIGGYCIARVVSKDEAIEWATRFAQLLGNSRVEAVVELDIFAVYET